MPSISNPRFETAKTDTVPCPGRRALAVTRVLWVSGQGETDGTGTGWMIPFRLHILSTGIAGWLRCGSKREMWILHSPCVFVLRQGRVEKHAVYAGGFVAIKAGRDWSRDQTSSNRAGNKLFRGSEKSKACIELLTCLLLSFYLPFTTATRRLRFGVC